MFQFLSVPSKYQTKGPVLQQLSLPCPETKVLVILHIWSPEKNVYPGPAFSLPLFHIHDTASQSHLPSNQPDLELHWDKTVTTARRVVPFP